MKNFKNYFMIVAVFGLLFTSCSKDESAINDDQESATLTFGAALQDFNKATMNKQQTGDDVGQCVDGEPAFAQITLEYSGTSETVIVPVLGDAASGYFTAYHDDLEIPVPSGDTHVTVTLTDFVVWADNNNDGSPETVLWVAPKWDSEYARFVTQPLGGDQNPYTWNLRAGSKTYTDVEVLCFDNRDVNRYGYQFFDIIPTELQNICFFANYCTDDGRHYTANYTLDLYTFNGEPTTERPTSLDGYNNLYDGIGLDEDAFGVDDGDYYADPLCVSIPNLGEGEYIYYEATVANWDANYPAPENHLVWGYVSQADIDALVAADGDDNPETMDYRHLFFNCPEGDSVVVTPPTGTDCPPAPGDNCVQLEVEDYSLNPIPTEDDALYLLLFDPTTNTTYGRINFELVADGENSDLIATFNLESGYVATAARISIADYINNSTEDDPITLCIDNLSENNYTIRFENLEVTVEDAINTVFPIMVDLEANICTTGT